MRRMILILVAKESAPSEVRVPALFADQSTINWLSMQMPFPVYSIVTLVRWMAVVFLYSSVTVTCKTYSPG